VFSSEFARICRVGIRRLTKEGFFSDGIMGAGLVSLGIACAGLSLCGCCVILAFSFIAILAVIASLGLILACFFVLCSLLMYLVFEFIVCTA
jgi:hypothetical protein